MRPDVILLNGTSSSGKSTLARALQRRAGWPLLHASLDTFTDMFLWEAVTDPAQRHACHSAGVDHFHQALALFAAEAPLGRTAGLAVIGALGAVAGPGVRTRAGS